MFTVWYGIPRGLWHAAFRNSFKVKFKIFITFLIYNAMALLPLCSKIFGRVMFKQIHEIHKCLWTASHSDCYAFWQPQKDIFRMFSRSCLQFLNWPSHIWISWYEVLWEADEGMSARGKIFSAVWCCQCPLLSVSVPLSVKGSPTFAVLPVTFCKSVHCSLFSHHQQRWSADPESLWPEESANAMYQKIRTGN